MPTEIKLNHVTNHEFVRSRIKHIDSVLEQLHLEDMTRSGKAHLQAMDTVILQEVRGVVKEGLVCEEKYIY